MESKLWIVTCYFNPLGIKSRKRLFEKFCVHVTQDLKIPLVIVHGTNETAVRIEYSPTSIVINIPLTSTLWVKEAMLNIGIKYIIKHHVYVEAIAWVDCDIHFHTLLSTSDVILSSLKHHHVSQIWNIAIDSGKQENSIAKINYSSMFQNNKFKNGAKVSDIETLNHSGYAWAATKTFLIATDGLLDCCIIGGADRIMLAGMQGEQSLISIDTGFSSGYKKTVHEWSEKAFTVTKGKVAYAPIPITHGYHGDKKNRKYKERHNILKKFEYDPYSHIERTSQGLWQWSSNAPDSMIQEISDYFVGRDEDDEGECPQTPKKYRFLSIFKCLKFF